MIRAEEAAGTQKLVLEVDENEGRLGSHVSPWLWEAPLSWVESH